jgi:site-specific DNA recombinase
LQRFKNEGYAAAQLHDPNIVFVFVVGCTKGVHYYAMQFIEGSTLAAFIRELRLEKDFIAGRYIPRMRLVPERTNRKMNAERGGFEAPDFRNFLPCHRFPPKPFHTHKLTSSGWSCSFPVVPRCEGRRPGQFLAKRIAPYCPPCGRDQDDRLPFQFPDPSRHRRRCSRRRGPRSRREVEDERQRLREATNRELDQIAAEFHARLPQKLAKAIGAIYARYSSRFQHSIADQVRCLYEAAVKQGIFVPRNHVSFDVAVRGFKEKRPGLNQIRDLLERKGIDVFLVFTTNRLFRKTYKALQFVEEEVVEQGIRALFVKSNIDTADAERWRILLQLHAMMDEFVVGMYAANIHAAQEGLFERRLVCGTISFGYMGEPIPGEFTKRNRPRCRVVIDPDAALWVQRVFYWFVVDRLSLDEIARRLNEDLSIPVGPRSISGHWNHLSVLKMLRNSRYRGYWQYGKSEAVWQGKKDYSRQIPRQEPLRSEQFDELRIVEDEIWYEAQTRLGQDTHANAGRKPKDGDRRSRPKLLNGLLRCPTHGQRLYAGGPHGKYMLCKLCRFTTAAQRPLFSHLPRELALRLTCEKLASLIPTDQEFVNRVIAACEREAARVQEPDPAKEAALRRREQQLTHQIQFLMANAGDTESDRQESAESLKSLRRQRTDMAVEIICVQGNRRHLEVPSETDVQAMLDELRTILAASAQDGKAEERGVVRQIIELLTGGRIDLYQQGERKSHRGWLQGRFRVRILDYLVGKTLGEAPSTAIEDGLKVVIDYREPDPVEREMEKAFEY